jgi:hypothetical protein
MRDFEYVLSLARGFAPCEEAALFRECDEPAVTPAVPRPKNARATAPDEHIPWPATASSRR